MARRPKRRLIAAPPISTGMCRPRRSSSCTQSGICLDVDTSSAERPIASAFTSDRLVEDRVHRHLLAEVEHGVAVVGEDRVDQRLADVVHVAVHGGEHDAALGVALGSLEELLEVLDRLLHHLGGLEHERQDQLAGAELVADLLHRGEQHVVEHAHGVLAHAGGVERLLRCLPSCGGRPSSGPSAPGVIALVGSTAGCASRGAALRRRP